MNLDYLPDTSREEEGHMRPNQDVLDIWKSFRKETQYNHIFEIGMNAGHSAAINLELFPNIKVTSLDIGKYWYTKVAGETLKERFAGRFDYHIRGSVAFHEMVRDGRLEIPKVDVVFIDGGHEWINIINDIAMAKLFGVKDVLIDDTNGLHDWSKKVNFVCKRFEEMKVLTLVNHYEYSSENQVSHYRL
jgi:hypothetical protein